jgi:uncharacterized protein (TIGR02246 family)
VTDEDQIRELQAIWGQLEADRDAEAWSQLFTEDATYIRPDGSRTVGRAAIRDSLIQRTAARPPGRHSAHVFGPAVIRVNGDSAESATDHVAFGRASLESPWEIIVVGRLNNRLVRQGGRWLFSEVANRGYYWGDPPPERLPGLPRR